MANAVCRGGREMGIDKETVSNILSFLSLLSCLSFLSLFILHPVLLAFTTASHTSCVLLSLLVFIKVVATC